MHPLICNLSVTIVTVISHLIHADMGTLPMTDWSVSLFLDLHQMKIALLPKTLLNYKILNYPNVHSILILINAYGEDKVALPHIPKRRQEYVNKQAFAIVIGNVFLFTCSQIAKLL